MDELNEITDKLRRFAKDRDWDKFHSPKNLSMALAGEVGELNEQFQWLTEQQSINLPSDKRKAVEAEIADILIYLIRLADILNINLLDAAKDKIVINEMKYPVDRVKGSSKKYTEY